MGNRTLLSILYHHIGNLHRTRQTESATLAAIAAFKAALELRPIRRQSRRDLLQLLEKWQKQPINKTQVDLYSAPVFTARFNKKGFRPLKVNGRKKPLKMKREHAFPRVISIHDLITTSEAADLMNASDQLVTDSYKNVHFDAWESENVAISPVGNEEGTVGSTRPDPIWCFATRQVLETILDEANATDLFPLEDDFLPETDGRCLSRSASNALTMSSRLQWVKTHNVYRGELPFLDLLDDRLEESLGLAAHHGGPWQVTKYQEGDQYQLHTDCVIEPSAAPTDSKEDDEPKKSQVQGFKRMATVLIYLSEMEPHQGGETEFPRMGFMVQPKLGKAVVWRNLDEDGNCNPLTEHVARPVFAGGSKIIMQRWYYEEATRLLNFRPGAPPLSVYMPGTPLIACDDVDSCRQYNDWTVNWANWKGFR